MELHFLGVRGSTPAPGPEYVRYGGNTSCVAVARDGELPSLVLDAGTGARRLAHRFDGQPFSGALLLSHLHWDHTHGLPFARALDNPDASVDLYLPLQLEGPGATMRADDVLGRGMGPPNFPITPEGLRGNWTFNALEPGHHEIAGFEVTAVEVPHKGGRTYGYRVSDGTKTMTYMSDHGPIAVGPGPDGLGERHRAALDLADATDALVHDAQYTLEEFELRSGFGHSTYEYAIDLGLQAGARRVVLFHHDPDRTDDELDRIVAGLQDRHGEQIEIIAATEDLVLRL
ncbi:MAG: MBL fold metallo-hydrolase [Acidimicrobiia bacterium]|nr:MBL fold metallo-hydrolase [Acidimicrobiia bacterium]